MYVADRACTGNQPEQLTTINLKHPRLRYCSQQLVAGNIFVLVSSSRSVFGGFPNFIWHQLAIANAPTTLQPSAVLLDVQRLLCQPRVTMTEISLSVDPFSRKRLNSLYISESEA